jgi:hypothetical protein
MTGKPIAFAWSDAWILLAVLYGDASVRGILAAADYVNQAVPTYAELDGALGRLRAAGCVAHERGRYHATLAMRRAYARTAKRRQTALKKLAALEAFLNARRAAWPAGRRKRLRGAAQARRRGGEGAAGHSRRCWRCGERAVRGGGAG